MEPYLSINETSHSQGERYTIITNKEVRGKKGCLIVMIKSTNSQRVKSLLIRKIPQAKRKTVKEITQEWLPVWKKLPARPSRKLL